MGRGAVDPLSVASERSPGHWGRGPAGSEVAEVFSPSCRGLEARLAWSPEQGFSRGLGAVWAGEGARQEPRRSSCRVVQRGLG